MRKRALDQVFRVFARINRVWEGEGGEGGAGSAGDGGGAPAAVADGGEGAASEGAPEGGEGNGGAAEQAPFDINTYVGDKKVNPDQRPLKKFNRTNMTKEQIDSMLMDSPDELIMTDEEIAAEAKEKKDKEEADAKDNASKDEKTDKKDNENGANEELDAKDFLDKTGLTQDEFDKLSEKAQATLVKHYEESFGSNQKAKELESKYNAIKTDLENFLKDPVVAARQKELETGQAFVASRVEGFTQTDLEEVNKLLALDKNKEALELLNKHLQEKSQDAVKHERAVVDRKIADTKARSEAHAVLMKLGEIDKRLTITDSDYSKIIPGHADFETMNSIIEFCQKKGITVTQINNFGPKMLYNMIASEKGWDKEREASIHEQGKQSLLQKLRNPTKVHTLEPGKRSSAAVSGKNQMAESRESLVEAVAKGDMSAFDKLLEAADGNPRRIAELGKIREEGVRRANEKRPNKQD